MTKTPELQEMIIAGIQERKGRRITVVDMSHIESAASPKFIIAEGQSSMQVSSIADSVREYLQEHGKTKPYNYDGYQNAEWIIIDYGEIMVHIFRPEFRERYNLEELWSDAVITEVADLD